MKTTRTFSALRCDASTRSSKNDALVCEAPLQICVNGEAFTTTMRSPGDDEALARGLLFTEGILADGAAKLDFSVAYDPETSAVARLDVTVAASTLAKPVAGRRSLLASASCGVCGTRSAEDVVLYGEPIAVSCGGELTVAMIDACMQQMRANQPLFDATGGAHGAALFDAAGALLAVREDIGRHNAVDKVVGWMLAHGASASILAVSGRVSYEIVYKAYRAGIPVLLAVGAASSMAVETAERMGMTLAGFCRDGRATVYAGGERIHRGVAESAEGAK